MNQNTQTIKRMYKATKSRKLIIGSILRKGFRAAARVMQMYGYIRTAQKELDARKAERGGLPFPVGGVIHEEGPEFIVGRFTPRNLITRIDPKNFEVRHEVIDDAAAWEKVKQRLSIPTIEEIEENHLRRMSNEEIKKEYCNDTRGEAQRKYDERMGKVKKDFAPINDFLKSVNKPELPTILNFSALRAGKTSALKEYLKDCISTDCCGKCEKDKPE